MEEGEKFPPGDLENPPVDLKTPPVDSKGELRYHKLTVSRLGTAIYHYFFNGMIELRGNAAGVAIFWGPNLRF